MKLKLSEVAANEGMSLPFDYFVSLEDTDINGEHIFVRPVEFSGEIVNRAGTLTLRADIFAVLHVLCARCAEEVDLERRLHVEYPIVREIFDVESDNIFAYAGDELELDDILVPELILSVDIQLLCKPDCKGLCPQCGANLNIKECDCKPTVDPRLEALKDFKFD